MPGFRCYDNIAPNEKCQRVLALALCLVIVRFIYLWQINDDDDDDEAGPQLSQALYSVPNI